MAVDRHTGRQRDNTGPVLVFDSGLGGLSVFAEIRKSLPGRPMHYLVDDAGFPYGERKEPYLVERVVGLMERAIETVDPALVVIACNTASTLVLPPLRARFDIPFVGTVPAIKPAAERSQSGEISVLATPATIARDYTRDLIRQFAGHCRVRLVGAPDLADMTERSLRGELIRDGDLLAQISPCFVGEGERRTDMVVLACTHFPFLSARFEALQPWPVTWLDPAPAIARRVADLLDIGGGNLGDRAMPDTAFMTGTGAASITTAQCFGRFGLSVAKLPFLSDDAG